ncbi:hypothetical protein U1Q18_050991 [Sarracenia purpurea var. burkii]
MESFKVLIAFALLVACAYAAGIPEPQQLAPKPEGPQGPLGPGPLPGAPLEAGPAREKKQALFPYAYAAYPYASYGAYPYAAAAAYPAYSYSYQYLDEGKYYPGKYDGKAYVRASPYYYNPYYYY